MNRDKFVFFLVVSFELKYHYDCDSRHLINALLESINIVCSSLFMLNKTTFEDEVVVIFPAKAKAPRLARENFPPFQGAAAWKN